MRIFINNQIFVYLQIIILSIFIQITNQVTNEQLGLEDTCLFKTNPCNNQGVCTQQGLCLCNTYYIGVDCEEEIPKEERSNLVEGEINSAGIAGMTLGFLFGTIFLYVLGMYLASKINFTHRERNDGIVIERDAQNQVQNLYQIGGPQPIPNQQQPLPQQQQFQGQQQPISQNIQNMLEDCKKEIKQKPMLIQVNTYSDEAQMFCFEKDQVFDIKLYNEQKLMNPQAQFEQRISVQSNKFGDMSVNKDVPDRDTNERRLPLFIKKQSAFDKDRQEQEQQDQQDEEAQFEFKEEKQKRTSKMNPNSNQDLVQFSQYSLQLESNNNNYDEERKSQGNDQEVIREEYEQDIQDASEQQSSNGNQHIMIHFNSPYDQTDMLIQKNQTFNEIKIQLQTNLSMDSDTIQQLVWQYKDKVLDMNRTVLSYKIQPWDTINLVDKEDDQGEGMYKFDE